MTGPDNAAGLSDEAAWGAGAENDEPARSWTELRDHGFSSDHGLTFANKWLNSFRQIEIGSTAEANDAQSIAASDGIALAQRAQDATGDQTGDLHHREFASIGYPQRDRIPLIGLACLVQAGVQEGAVPIGDSRDSSRRRHPVYV